MHLNTYVFNMYFNKHSHTDLLKTTAVQIDAEVGLNKLVNENMLT